MASMLSCSSKALAVAIAGFLLFATLVVLRGPSPPPKRPGVSDRIVISAPVQVLLAGGDPFLAADFEAIRAAATAEDSADSEANASFRIRAHRVVAQLNPCHEDNYYVANAMLSWGGAPTEGLEVLRRATHCRTWDEFPPFFLGFNEWFFNRDAQKARQAMELAASRAADSQQAATLKRIGVMIETGEFADQRVALAFLRQEKTRATDERLREMLDRRITRLEGLITLREAQARYEAQMGRSLKSPQALLDEKFLDALPQDPLRLGYEFRDGQFRLREVKIPGMERKR
ncbi:conserved protein of unknown function [Thauera humireducens]|uniref:hypothetical protein n=1 Tax=Thauera humireducens TaxID=1134435 RepID=UPI002467AB75|nr:hypothetical protein [Thauera humireducens]CAH1746896.1 conserved protein of unknown function [Thauera humireducens]